MVNVLFYYQLQETTILFSVTINYICPLYNCILIPPYSSIFVYLVSFDQYYIPLYQCLVFYFIDGVGPFYYQWNLAFLFQVTMILPVLSPQVQPE